MSHTDWLSSPSIFLSYRRADSSGESGRLADRLAGHYGHHRVFFDVHAIQAGVNYERALERARQSARVVLAVIGPAWASSTASGSRLDDKDDPVRLEIQSALSRGIALLPILVKGAQLPIAATLPSDIATLASIQAHRINHDTFSRDFDALTHLLNGMLQPLDEATELQDQNSAPDDSGAQRLVLGGTIPPGRGIYIRREADARIAAFLDEDRGSLSVTGPRQTGKSSLLAAAGVPAKKKGRQVVFMDLSTLGKPESFDQYVYSLALHIAHGFEADLPRDSFMQHPVTAFFEFVDGLPSRTILIFDEIDILFSSEHGELLVDLITTLQRRCLSASVHLSCIISGVVLPHFGPLQSAVLQSSEQIYLAHFGSLESKLYLERVGLHLNDDDFKTLFALTGGQPYLLAIAAHRLSDGATLATLSRESGDKNGPFGFHVQWVSRMLGESAHLKNALRKFVRGKQLEGPERQQLLELGVLKQSHGMLRLASSFYPQLLD